MWPSCKYKVNVRDKKDILACSWSRLQQQLTYFFKLALLCVRLEQFSLGHGHWIILLTVYHAIVVASSSKEERESYLYKHHFLFRNVI